MTVRDLITYLLEFNLDADVKLLDNYLPADFNVSWVNDNGGDSDEPWTPEIVRKRKLEAKTIFFAPEGSEEQEQESK